MSEKNIKSVELADEQLEQVSGGNGMRVNPKRVPSLTGSDLQSADSNLQSQESDEEKTQPRSFASMIANQPRPRE